MVENRFEVIYIISLISKFTFETMSNFIPAGLSSVGNFAGEIQQVATKAKNGKRIEDRIEVYREDLTPEPINQAIKSFTKWLGTCEDILVVDKLNTCCDDHYVYFLTTV